MKKAFISIIFLAGVLLLIIFNLQGELNIQPVDALEKTPSNILEAIETIKFNRGYYLFNPEEYSTEDKSYLLICAGEKNTGGYDVEIKSLAYEKDTVVVKIEETSPAADEMVTQVITYPYVLFIIDSNITDITVVSNDDTLTQLN